MVPPHNGVTQPCPSTQLLPSLSRPRPLFCLPSLSNYWASILAPPRAPYTTASGPLLPWSRPLIQFPSPQPLNTTLYFYASSAPASTQSASPQASPGSSPFNRAHLIYSSSIASRPSPLDPSALSRPAILARYTAHSPWLLPPSFPRASTTSPGSRPRPCLLHPGRGHSLHLAWGPQATHPFGLFFPAPAASPCTRHPRSPQELKMRLRPRGALRQ